MMLGYLLIATAAVGITVLFKLYVPQLVIVPPVLAGGYVAKKFAGTASFGEIIRRILYSKEE